MQRVDLNEQQETRLAKTLQLCLPQIEGGKSCLACLQLIYIPDVYIHMSVHKKKETQTKASMHPVHKTTDCQRAETTFEQSNTFYQLPRC